MSHVDGFLWRSSLVRQPSYRFVLRIIGFSCVFCSQLLAQARPQGPDEDGTRSTLMNIAGRGLLDSPTYDCLTDLSDTIGGRITGSPAAQTAIQWGAARMRAAGLVNVHAEEWSFWKGWQRGTASAEMIAPMHRTLYVDSIGWTGSTSAGGGDADVVPVNLFKLEDAMKDTARFRGKIILLRVDGDMPKNFGVLMMQYGAFLRELQPVGVMAVIVGSEAGFKIGGHAFDAHR